MSHGRAIDYLPLDEFPTEQDSSDPGFEQLFSSLVGDAASDADGFDVAVAEASALLDSMQGALDALGGQTGGTLDDTFAEILTVDPEEARADLLNLTAALPDFQTSVDKLGNDLAAAALPAPPAGGAPAGPPPCAAQLGFGDPGPPYVPYTQTVYFHNPTSGPITVQDVRLFPDQPGVYTVTTQCAGVTLNPGDSCLITVTLNTQPGPGVGVQIVLDTDVFGAINLCAGTGLPLGVATGGGGIGSGPPSHCGGAQVIRQHLRLPVGKHPVFGFCA
jgi:hypothetical protein